MSEDKTDYTADEFLDWLCWSWAMDGRRFYPPDETAQECMNALPDDFYEDGEEYEHARGWEEGQHERSWSNAIDKFDDMQRRGLNPVERAAREHRKLMKRAEYDMSSINWSWWTDR